MYKTIIALALLLTQVGGDAPVQASLTANGILMGFATFQDGGSITVAYQEQNDINWIVFVYTDPNGEMLATRENLPAPGLPDQAIVNVCGTHIQASLNWTREYTPQSAPIYRYDWQLPADSGICTLNTMYFPFTQHQKQGAP